MLTPPPSCLRSLWLPSISSNRYRFLAALACSIHALFIYFSESLLLTLSVPACTIYMVRSCGLYYSLICHVGTSVHILPPPCHWRCALFVFVTGPGPSCEVAVSMFSRSPLGRANTFSFLSLSLNTPKYHILVLAGPLFLFLRLLLSCTPIVSMGIVYYCVFILYPSVISRLHSPTHASSPFSYGVP